MKGKRKRGKKGEEKKKKGEKKINKGNHNDKIFKKIYIFSPNLYGTYGGNYNL